MKFTKRTIALVALENNNFISNGAEIPFTANKDYLTGDFAVIGYIAGVVKEDVLEGKEGVILNRGTFLSNIKESSPLYTTSTTPGTPYSINYVENSIWDNSASAETYKIVIKTLGVKDGSNSIDVQLPIQIGFK